MIITTTFDEDKRNINRDTKLILFHSGLRQYMYLYFSSPEDVGLLCNSSI